MNISTKISETSWSAPTEYFYVRNAQGDIIGLIDKAGTQVVSYTYDSWGKLISIEGTLKDIVGVKNPYRYRGYRYDSETQLYYLQSRYYNPSWGRFINADAIIGQTGELLGHNMFAYCKNNAINRKDDHGFLSSSVFGEGGEGYGDIGSVEVESAVTSNEYLSAAVDVITGIASIISQNAPQIVVESVKENGLDILKVLPKCITPENWKPYASIASKVSSGFTAAMAGIDLYNIWATNSSLSGFQKGLKSIVKIGAIGAGVYVGALAGAGAIALGGGIYGAAIIVGGTSVGSVLIGSTEKWLNKSLGLGG